jgi:hypothetical protein
MVCFPYLYWKTIAAIEFVAQIIQRRNPQLAAAHLVAAASIPIGVTLSEISFQLLFLSNNCSMVL